MKDIRISDEMKIAIEKGIHLYFEKRQQEVAVFVQKHFSFQEVFRLQKKILISDLLLYPANSLWTFAYLGLKQVLESLNRMGWRKFSPLLTHLPTGIPTNYQKQIEKMIVVEILGFSKDGKPTELLNSIQSLLSEASPKINSSPDSNSDDEILPFELEEILKIRFHLKDKLEKYTSSRRFVADLAGNITMMATGWLLFGNHGLSVSAIGQKIAKIFARDRAASGFFMGKSLGQTFYQIFPPEPSKTQVMIATLFVGFLFTFASIVSGMLSDPLRKSLGLQEGNLQDFLNEFESAVLLETSRYFKSQNSKSDLQKQSSHPRKTA